MRRTLAGVPSIITLLVLSSLLAAQELQPPRVEGKFRRPDLVELVEVDRTLRLDVRYATPNNFTGRAVYLKIGRQVSMPGGDDEMAERSHITYAGGTAEQRRRRDLLRAAMEAEGFLAYEPEWWHYDYKDWREYPILDLSFSEPRPAKTRAKSSHCMTCLDSGPPIVAHTK